MRVPTVVTSPALAETQRLCLLRWSPIEDRLQRPDGQAIPADLCPLPQQPWLTQLADSEQQAIIALQRSGQPGQLSLPRGTLCWWLEWVPDRAGDWLIMAYPQQLAPAANMSGLEQLELERLARLSPGARRNHHLLQQLYHLSGCGRLVLWRIGRERLEPVYRLGEGELPPAQILDPRYIKALRARGTLGFSDVSHQPMLASQQYLQQDAILARLDALISQDRQPWGVLTLEYRSWQPRFADDLFPLAARTAALLLDPEQDSQLWPAAMLASRRLLPQLDALRSLRSRQRMPALLHLLQPYGVQQLQLWHYQEKQQTMLHFWPQPGQSMLGAHQRPCTSQQVSSWLASAEMLHPLPDEGHGLQGYQLILRSRRGHLAGLLQCFGAEATALEQLAPQLLDAAPLLAGLLPAPPGIPTDLRQLLQAQPLPALLLDRQGQIRFANQPWRTWRQSLGENQPVTQMAALLPRHSFLPLLRHLLRQLRHQGCYITDEFMLQPDGTLLPVHMRLSAWHHQQELAGFCCVMEDLGQTRAARQRLAELAGLDELTGMANRRALFSALSRPGETNHQGLLMLLDITPFKTINDSLGHQIGDLLLQHIASRLQRWAGPLGLLARSAGAQFALLIPPNEPEHHVLRQQADNLLRALHALFERPFLVNGIRLYCSCTQGIALFHAGMAALDIMQQAETAAHLARQHAERGYLFYTDQLGATVRRRMELVTRLREALNHQQLVLFYQPQYAVTTGQLMGAEALLRWPQDEEFIPPSEFIPLAEETGLIHDIGLWVLRVACEQHCQWLHSTHPLPRLSVNISARQFHHPDFLQQLDRILSETRMPPSQLTLELTESLVMENQSEAIQRLASLRERGIQLSIDDFGTGYSSLAYLKNLPIDEVKLDRRFIQRLAEDHKDQVLVSAIMALSAVMGFDVLAEGVETEAQRTMLEQLGCHFYQGFLRSRAIPAVAFSELLRSQV